MALDPERSWECLSITADSIDFLQFVFRLLEAVSGFPDKDGHVQVPLERLEELASQLDKHLKLEDYEQLARPSQHPVEKSAFALSKRCRRLAAHVQTRISHAIGTSNGQHAKWPLDDLRALAEVSRNLGNEFDLVLAPELRKEADLESVLSQATSKLSRSDVEACARNVSQYNSLLDRGSRLPSSLDSRNEPVWGNSDTINQILDLKALEQQANCDKGEVLQDFILENLKFKSMYDREDEIAMAHQKTFDWAFDSTVATGSQVNLLQWLHDDHLPLFWITGKPGSGKSTLMRYLSDHKRLLETLKLWAGKKRLAVAGFYFWISGSIEQRSQIGLLRHLLHQLLEQNRHLIPLAFPALWKRCWDSSTRDRIQMVLSWEVGELEQAFKTYLTHSASHTRTTILIDGLDEFSGSHEYIVGLLRQFISLAGGDLKLCVSSREWETFERAFQETPKLRLQALTSGDMLQFAEDCFFRDDRVLKVQSKEAEDLEHIRKQLLCKADGVFLWISLAIKYLLDELSINTNNIKAVVQLLDKLPTDLEDLFNYLLFQIQSADQIKAACQIFEILKAREEVCSFTGDESVQSPLLWDLVLAVKVSPAEALEAQITKIPDAEIIARCNQTCFLLTTSCAGLIQAYRKRQDRESRVPMVVGKDEFDELHKVAEGKVTYRHRTVKDYLASEKVEKVIHSGADMSQFDADLSHLVACIMRLKWPLEAPEKHRRLDDRWSLVVLALTHARHARSSVPIVLPLVEELDKAMTSLWMTRRADGSDTWAWSCFGSFEERAKIDFDDPWLSLLVRFGLADCVEAKLRGVRSLSKGGRPVLHFAVEYLVDRQKTVYPLSNPRLVETLITHGSDVNMSYGNNMTVWRNALSSVRQAYRRQWIKHYDLEDEGVFRWAETLQVFLSHGADPNAFLRSTPKDPAVTTLEASTMVLDRYGLSEVEKLRDRLIGLGARQEGRGKELEAAEASKAVQQPEKPPPQVRNNPINRLIGRPPGGLTRLGRRIPPPPTVDERNDE